MKEALNNKTLLNYKEHRVRKIMAENLKMSYKKIAPVAVHTNSPKNLILR